MEAAVAEEIAALNPQGIRISSFPSVTPARSAGGLILAVNRETPESTERIGHSPESNPAGLIDFEWTREKGGVLHVSHPSLLYCAWRWLRDIEWEKQITLPVKRSWRVAFPREKSTFDLFLTQYARSIRDFDRERYVREYARIGFSHIEVNALAGENPIEEAEEGEFYSQFYTYCPALDQFVSSSLNAGLYPQEFISANLARLKHNARFALKYGLIPGLLCFEPRSQPEQFFSTYPTLRGARVDHPFRSFRPRFSLALSHPAVRRHYQELVTNLLLEVPELEYLTIWTNDSGAGFEHTKSLYVGRNGGPYLIREWRDDRAIARAAAENALSFFRLLRDAGRCINPRFRVVTRLEPLSDEMEFFRPGIANGIDVEVNSLLAKGWEAPYPHPKYPEIKVLGSALHHQLYSDEKKKRKDFSDKGSESFFYHSFGSHTNHEPLLGIPFPWLTLEKLKSAYALGMPALSHIGGIHPPDKVPFAVNQEVFRMFQMNPGIDMDQAVGLAAEQYVGLEFAGLLVSGWKFVDVAVRSFPPMSIYTHYGSVWQRLLVRPLVPDIDSIPEEDRAYYERFMCSSRHNPNRVDLRMDVLFDLLPPEAARKAWENIDGNVLPKLDEAISAFSDYEKKKPKTMKPPAGDVFADQLDRVRALKCWSETLRNTAVWIDSVHSCLSLPKEDGVRALLIERLQASISREISNTEAWIQLWESSPVEWMIISGCGETAFIYGRNFGELMRKKLELMRKYRNTDPNIDPEYMFRLTKESVRWRESPDR